MPANKSLIAGTKNICPGTRMARSQAPGYKLHRKMVCQKLFIMLCFVPTARCH